MEKGSVHLVISGLVQGVFYRASTRDMAIKSNLCGWVRNLPSGKVEAVFEGKIENLKDAVQWCEHGPPGADVTDIQEEWGQFSGEFASFEVRYY